MRTSSNGKKTTQSYGAVLIGLERNQPTRPRKVLAGLVVPAVILVFIVNALSWFSSAEAAENTQKTGCMTRIDAQNIEVIASNEVLGADNSISLRAKISDARDVIADLRSRLDNCNNEHSRGHIRNTIKKIESVIEQAKEAFREKISISDYNERNIERNIVLKRFNEEKIERRPDFCKLEEIVEVYSKLPNASEQVISKMKRFIRGKGSEIGKDVIVKLNKYIKKKNVSGAVKEYKYLVKNTEYLRVLGFRVTQKDFNYYSRKIIKLGGKVDKLDNAEGEESDIPEELKSYTYSHVKELAKDLHGGTTEPAKIINTGNPNVMDDLKDLGIDDSADESEYASSFDDIIKEEMGK